MSIAKAIEISSSSITGIDDAIRSGPKKVAETVKGIQGAWISETKGRPTSRATSAMLRVNLRETFVVQ